MTRSMIKQGWSKRTWTGIVFCILGTSFLLAREPLPYSEPNTESAVNSSTTPESNFVRFLLTSKGKLLEGIPEERGDRYLLKLPDNKGGLQISKLDVVFIGTTRASVFDFQRGLIQEGNPVEAVKLAEWCVHNQLASEGIAFLKKTLAATTATETKEILQRQIDQMEYVERLKDEANKRMAAAESKEEEKESIDSESQRLDAFGRQIPLSVQEKFARRIQPVLLRRCAVTDCHQEGTPGTNFILIKPDRRGTIKKENLRNLKMVFEGVDFTRTAASPILNHPAIEDERGNQIYPFGNDSASLKDYQLFTEWLDFLGTKMRNYRPDPNSSIPKIAEPSPENGTVLNNQAVVDLTLESTDDAETQETAVSFGLNDEEMAELDQMIPAKSTQERHISVTNGVRDEFDPAIFNQKYHPDKAGLVEDEESEENF